MGPLCWESWAGHCLGTAGRHLWALAGGQCRTESRPGQVACGRVTGSSPVPGRRLVLLRWGSPLRARVEWKGHELPTCPGGRSCSHLHSARGWAHTWPRIKFSTDDSIPALPELFPITWVCQLLAFLGKVGTTLVAPPSSVSGLEFPGSCPASIVHWVPGAGLGVVTYTVPLT